MRKWITLISGMAWAAVSAFALPANCTTGTYTSYIALGAGGCQDGDATFSNFSNLTFVNIGIGTISPDNLEVIPGGTALAPTLTFVYFNSGVATPITVSTNGTQFAMGFNYQMTLTGASLVDIMMNSNFANSTPGSASATKNATLLGGGPTSTSTVSDQGSSNALGNHAGNLASTTGTGVWLIGDATSLQAQTAGSVTQANFENLFTLAAAQTGVPEPVTGVLIGSGLLCLGLVSRRKRQTLND
jgi:hypothetical protein